MKLIDDLAEEKIRAARDRGEFEGLPGAGRPLDLDDDRGVPPELRMAYRVLKNAGCLPPEVAARRELSQLSGLLAQAVDGESAARLGRRLALLAARIGLRPDSPYYRALAKRGERDTAT